MAEAFGTAANAIAIIEVSVKIASLCLVYSKAVKNAKDDISRLQIKVEGLENVALEVKRLLSDDRNSELSTSQNLERAVASCLKQMNSVQERLNQSKGRKTMSKFGLRSLKWPFESKEVDKIIRELEASSANITSALQVDQTRTILDIRKHIDLEKIPSARDSAFDAHHGNLNARCHPDTRTDLLLQVQQWADDPQGRCIYWLKGMAGTGKSTISRTVAQSFDDDGRLGASFFFKRGEGDRGNATRFFTTIVGQLLRRIPDLIPPVRAAIQKHPDIAEKPLNQQFNKLIFEPLSLLGRFDSKDRLVLVVDALDECEGERNIREIIHLLSKMQELTVHIRVFLTSRPELPIRLGFSTISSDMHQDIQLQDIPLATVEHDISAFLKNEFAKIRSDYNQAYPPESSIPPDWPDDESIKILTKTAVPLFIFAATICRFVGDTWKWNPKKRLATVLEFGITAQTSQLDQTYLPVLRQLEEGRSESDMEDLGRDFRKVIGSIVVLEDSLSVESLARLFDMPKEDLFSSLHHLHSVLSVPSDLKSPVQLLHLSFREFLVDPKKKSRNFWFWTDEKITHSEITARCLEELSIYLKENTCSLEFPGMLKSDLDIETINESLPPHIQYSCRYWVHHLAKCCKRICDGDEVHNFLSGHFLHWIEALAILGRVSDSIRFMDILLSLADKNKALELSGFLHDSKRFLLQNRWIVNEAPLQLYSSALIFSPETSVVKNMFRSRIPTWIRRSPKMSQSAWGAELQKFEGYNEWVGAVGFSPDGKQLITVSKNRTIVVWDVATGEELQKVEGTNHGVFAVAISPEGTVATGCVVSRLDGKQLAPGLEEETIMLWDTSTGREIQSLGGHDDVVKAVAFSPDGRQLASGGRTIRLWDTATGQEIRELEGHTAVIWAIAFSPDGKQLASGSKDRTARLWDAATGAELKRFEGHRNSVLAVTFSLDGKWLASGSWVTTIWDTTTGKELRKLGANTHVVRAIAFSPNGKQVASGSDDFMVRLWDAATGRELKRLEGHRLSIVTVAFSPDGKQLASGSADQTVTLWDTTTSEAVTKPEERSAWATELAFSPDGKQLASAFSDQRIKLWDAATGNELRKLEGDNHDWTEALAFSADGKHLASLSHLDTVKRWDVATGKELKDSVSQEAIMLQFPRLMTDTSTNMLFVTSPGRPAPVSPLPRASDGIGLSGKWITWKGRNFLWLPRNYRRPSFSASHGNTLSIGQPNGDIFFFEFA
ncbi:hypothetical protein TWF718_000418 [Orbilia javanica]|uniref:Mitochondrial division protein 1 n=1 Tax=Orbilia javanica TaxID=47235 RepID=A0AAN8NFB4_9PEZI